MTRKTTAHLFHSVNGVVESPERWQFDAFGAEEAQLMGEVTAPVTEIVMGRTLWQEWSDFWPHSDNPFGQWINPIRKHVLSTTLPDDLTWNSTVVRSETSDYIRDLREQGTGEISIVGGIETIRSLFLEGLIDELTLTTHPVFTNEGRRLFDDSVPLTRLRLLRTAQTEAGNAVLTYGLRQND